MPSSRERLIVVPPVLPQNQNARRKIPTTAIFYFNGTFLERTNGAHLRAASLIFFLQQRFERVILYSYANHPTCPWSDGLIQKFKVMYPSVPLRSS